MDESTFGPGRTVLVKRLAAPVMLQPIAVGHKSLADYTHVAGKPLVEEIRALADELEGAEGAAPLGHRLRRRGLGDPLHARAADERRRHRGRVAGDARARGVLQRHEAAPQRAPGQPAGPLPRGVAGLRQVQRDERPRGDRRLGRDHRPRPPAGRDPSARAGEVQELDLALPHRPVHARTRPRSSAWCRCCAPTTAPCSTCSDYVPGGHGRRAASTSARPPSTRCRRRTWPSRPRTPRTSATSSASTSTGRCMCQVSRFDPWKDPMGVIDAYRQREGGDARRAAGAGRVDGHRRPRGLGVLQRDDGLRRRATPTSTSSTTSTTSARSR